MKNNNPSAPHILLVDDNLHNLQVLGKLLQEEKYKTEFAIDGISALEWMKKWKFDLILLDLNMPGMNGFEVCKKIRSEEKKFEVPIIFLSAESERESILKGFEVGAQDYVTKPFDIRELLARVKTQLDLKSKTENLEKINQWLVKKIEHWLKTSIGRKRSLDTTNLSDKLIEFDNNQGLVLKDISLEIRTSINEIERVMGKEDNRESNDLLKDIIERMEDAVEKLERI